MFNNLFSKIVPLMRYCEKNIVEPDRSQMTKWCMRFACGVRKATNTLAICNTYCFSTATMAARTRRNVTLYVHCVSCYKVGQQSWFYLVIFKIKDEQSMH